MQVARSFFARRSGMSTQDRRSCGIKAKDSACEEEEEGLAELR
jgi:hypothetical protein